MDRKGAMQKKIEGFPVRELALTLLMEIMEEGRFCDRALHQALGKNSLSRRDRSFLTRLVEGTVERCLEIDYILNQFSKVKTKKMKPVIRNMLRLSVYQILYMEQVPDAAACNEAVKLAVKWKLSGLKGYVNGVLRNVARGREKISYPDRADTVCYLSVRYSMPEWIVREFLRQYGRQQTEKILVSFLEEKKGISVRLTESRFTRAQIKEELAGAGVSVQEGILFPFALSLSGYSSLGELKAFQDGMFQVQDESSMLVGAIAGIQAGNLILDVCAAPGGKTFHAAECLMLAGQQNAFSVGKVISCDLTEEKVRLIHDNCRRLHYHNVEIVVQDATLLKEEWIGKADLVIADLPCSGLGVIGKKPDIKYKTKKKDIGTLARLQRQILSVASQYLKPGGRLVYSTCTITQEENRNNAKWIAENLGLSPESIEGCLPKHFQGLTGKEGYLQVLPDMAGTDGFFVSLFKRHETV